MQEHVLFLSVFFSEGVFLLVPVGPQVHSLWWADLDKGWCWVECLSLYLHTALSVKLTSPARAAADSSVWIWGSTCSWNLVPLAVRYHPCVWSGASLSVPSLSFLVGAAASCSPSVAVLWARVCQGVPGCALLWLCQGAISDFHLSINLWPSFRISALLNRPTQNKPILVF